MSLGSAWLARRQTDCTLGSRLAQGGGTPRPRGPLGEFVTIASPRIPRHPSTSRPQLLVIPLLPAGPSLANPRNRANRHCREWAYQSCLTRSRVRLSLVASIVTVFPVETVPNGVRPLLVNGPGCGYFTASASRRAGLFGSMVGGPESRPGESQRIAVLFSSRYRVRARMVPV